LGTPWAPLLLEGALIAAALRLLHAFGLRVGTGTRGLVASLGLVLTLGFTAWLLAMVTFILLADKVMDHTTHDLDLATLHWLRTFHTSTLENAANLASTFGSEVLVGLWVLLVSVLGFQRRWSDAAGLAIVMLGASSFHLLLKLTLQRPPPEVSPGVIVAQSFSFPSGHAAAAAALYGYLSILAWQRWHGWRRYFIVLFMASLIVAVGLSRLFLGYHYLTDVIAGWIAGFLWADSVALSTALLRRHQTRRDAESSTVEPLADVVGAPQGAH